MEGAADGQQKCNPAGHPINGLGPSALVRLAQAQNQLHTLGMCAEWMENHVMCPAGAQPDFHMSTSFPQVHAASPQTALAGLWPQMKKLPFSAQWIHQPSTMLLNHPVFSRSNSSPPSHGPLSSESKSPVNLQHMHRLQKPVYNQGLGNIVYQPLDCTRVGGHSGLLVGPAGVDKKIVFNQGALQGSGDFAFEVGHNEGAHKSGLHAPSQAMEPHNVGTYQGVNTAGLQLGSPTPVPGEAGKVPEGNHPNSACSRQTSPASCIKVNNSGFRESCTFENNSNHFQEVGNEIAKAFICKFGDEAFQRMRSLLLKQQEIFVSQVWDLHRLQWFQTYLQTSRSQSLEGNDEIQELSNEAILAKQLPLRTHSTVNNNSNGWEYIVGNGSVNALDPLGSKNDLPEKACLNSYGNSLPHNVCPSAQKQRSAIRQQESTQVKKFANRQDDNPQVKREDVEMEPNMVGSGKNELIKHEFGQGSIAMQVPLQHGRSSGDQAKDYCCKDQSYIHGPKSDNWARGPHWLSASPGVRTSYDQEVSSSRMNAGVSWRSMKEDKSDAMDNDKTVQEQSFLLQSYIDRAIGMGEPSDRRAPQKEIHSTSRKQPGIFKKKKRKMSKHANMPAKMRKKSEKFNLVMECESIGSGRSGSSTSNQSLTHTTPRETNHMKL